MELLLNVVEAAELLGLNPQTLYRKVARGEINALRFGRSIRFRRKALLGEGEGYIPHRSRTVPAFMHSLFWDIPFNEIRLMDEIVIERVLEFGDRGAVRWLQRNVPERKIKAWLQRKGKRRLSKRSLCFWSLLLNVTNESEHPIEGATDALGETRWR